MTDKIENATQPTDGTDVIQEEKFCTHVLNPKTDPKAKVIVAARVEARSQEMTEMEAKAFVAEKVREFTAVIETVEMEAGTQNLSLKDKTTYVAEKVREFTAVIDEYPNEKCGELPLFVRNENGNAYPFFADERRIKGARKGIRCGEHARLVLEREMQNLQTDIDKWVKEIQGLTPSLEPRLLAVSYRLKGGEFGGEIGDLQEERMGDETDFGIARRVLRDIKNDALLSLSSCMIEMLKERGITVYREERTDQLEIGDRLVTMRRQGYADAENNERLYPYHLYAEALELVKRVFGQEKELREELDKLHAMAQSKAKLGNKVKPETAARIAALEDQLGEGIQDDNDPKSVPDGLNNHDDPADGEQIVNTQTSAPADCS